MPLFCQPGNAEHLSIWLKGPLEGCSTVAASFSGTELPRVPPPAPLLAPSSPRGYPRSPRSAWSPLSSSTVIWGVWLLWGHLLPFGSTLGYLHPGPGGEPKSVKLCLQPVPGGGLQIWPPGPIPEMGESRPTGLHASHWDWAGAVGWDAVGRMLAAPHVPWQQEHGASPFPLQYIYLFF